MKQKITLTAAEKSALELRHQTCKDGKERDRIKAILLSSQGWSAVLIGQALRIHPTTIIRHLQEYEAGKLKNESGGSSGQLTQAQTQELIAHLEAHTYHHNFEIVLYVKEHYGMTYTVAGMHKWLHRNEFSYKKPKGQPHKADPHLQQQFIEEYEQIKQQAGPNEAILFMDAVHPTQATKLSYGWIRTGQTKQVETTASRTRLNIVGAIQLGQITQAITGV